ncbi:MAG: DUF47 domain-containing protein [Spirochaetes bacterium]|nr:DUF47 domain-containing protein [Spirochaetota bacterium]
MFKLIPTDDSFFDRFQEAAAILLEGSKVLLDLVGHPERIAEDAAKLERLEHDADLKTHEILVKLDKSFITPIDREDIHALALALDDCMDYIEAVSERMMLYDLKAATPPMQEMAVVLGQQAVQIHAAMPLMKTLNYEKIKPYLIETNRQENLGDKIARQAVAELFRGEKNPLEVMKWRDVYDFLEIATDKCEHVAGILEGILLKHG